MCGKGGKIVMHVWVSLSQLLQRRPQVHTAYHIPHSLSAQYFTCVCLHACVCVRVCVCVCDLDYDWGGGTGGGGGGGEGEEEEEEEGNIHFTM
jgi:hypothetical protein